MLLTLTRGINQVLGPFMLRNGLRVRCALSGGIVTGDNLLLDNLVGLPLSQRLLSLELRDAADRAVATGKVDGSLFSWWWKTLNIFQSNTSDDIDKDESSATTTAPNNVNLDNEVNLRLAVLEKYMRPSLVPNEKWSDVQKWQFHSRLIKWARKEYLSVTHGPQVRAAFVAFPELQTARQLARRRRTITRLLAGKMPFDNNNTANARVPSTMLVKNSFGMQKWAKEKVHGATRNSMTSIAKRIGGYVLSLRGGALCLPNIPEHADLSKLSMGDILELVGGHVAKCGPLNVLCEELDIYQLWTREYIEELGKYLSTRAESHEGETLILDVGAGDGLLADLLREYFKTAQQSNKPEHHGNKQRSRATTTPTIIATDDGSWGIFEKANVERMGYERALGKYCSDDASDHSRQVIVLCSWMPMNEDWSAEFRSWRVNEYICIGECDDGQCGDNWETWGNPHMLSDLAQELQQKLDNSNNNNSSTSGTRNKNAAMTPSMPPYKKDGYLRKNLDNLAVHQFSRFDSTMCKAGMTVSFRYRGDTNG